MILERFFHFPWDRFDCRTWTFLLITSSNYYRSLISYFSGTTCVFCASVIFIFFIPLYMILLFISYYFVVVIVFLILYLFFQTVWICFILSRGSIENIDSLFCKDRIKFAYILSFDFQTTLIYSKYVNVIIIYIHRQCIKLLCNPFNNYLTSISILIMRLPW